MTIVSADAVDTGRPASPSVPTRSRYVRDPWAEVRVRQLRLGRQCWQQGAVAQAIAVYTDILVRYQGMEAAKAAAEELLEVASGLEQQGRFWTALDLYERVGES